MKMKSKFKNLLEHDALIILDGGLATELEAKGHDLNTSLWSAGLLLNHPQAIIDAHLAYLNAGAHIITTATYQASIKGFMSIGLSADQAEKLMLDAVDLAQQAIARYCQQNPGSTKPLIAASIGPYGAYLADGSEYKGDYQVDNLTLTDFHRSRLILLDKSDADMLGCETIPSFQEAQVLAALLNQMQTPSWISFSCCDGQHLNDGSEIKQVAALFEHHTNVLAIGINCTAPKYISELVAQIKLAAPEKPVIVYPNSGELYDGISKTWISTEEAAGFCQLAELWQQMGVQIIGGCCRIGPALINTITTLHSHHD